MIYEVDIDWYLWFLCEHEQSENKSQFAPVTASMKRAVARAVRIELFTARVLDGYRK